MGVTVLVVAVAGALALDQLGLWAERRGWIYWRKKKGTGGPSGALEYMDTLFSPSTHNVVQERESKRLTRVDSATGEELDLESGTVFLAMRDRTDSPGDPLRSVD
ncbi:DUF6191 domain-containing protein [Rhodococcus sp. WMMA185]|uniref:DUF6191 domain-containing protein n=1 Tax=Rhodococcus sp. WMMA185 TaxID=679318 RepID=UPI0008789845|nr:DUF6191 domain-containing protein [Rhodococcus sp. WMMA185]